MYILATLAGIMALCTPASAIAKVAHYYHRNCTGFAYGSNPFSFARINTHQDMNSIWVDVGTAFNGHEKFEAYARNDIIREICEDYLGDLPNGACTMLDWTFRDRIRCVKPIPKPIVE